MNNFGVRFADGFKYCNDTLKLVLQNAVTLRTVGVNFMVQGSTVCSRRLDENYLVGADLVSARP